MSRLLYLLGFLSVLAAGCGRRDDTQCMPPDPATLLRFTLTDTAGNDLLQGGRTGIRVNQLCRADTLIPVYDYALDPVSKDTTTVLSFSNLIFPQYMGDNAKPGCARIYFLHPSVEEDVVSWSYHMSEGVCRSPVIDEVRFNGTLVAREATADNRYSVYHLIRR